MRKPKDLTGKRFGRLCVIKWAGYKSCKNGKHLSMYECKCDCGNTKILDLHSLDAGTQSCGCLLKEKWKKAITKHGRRYTRLYSIWAAMNKRCGHIKNYYDVTVCKEWKDFNTFYEWAMNNGYSDKLTIDRIDPYGNYEPSNCRWITRKEQANNKRNTRYYEIEGIKHTVPEWAEIYGVDAEWVRGRLRRGYDIRQALIRKKFMGNRSCIKVLETGEVFDTARECAKAKGILYYIVLECKNGKRESYNGYHIVEIKDRECLAQQEDNVLGGC